MAEIHYLTLPNREQQLILAVCAAMAEEVEDLHRHWGNLVGSCANTQLRAWATLWAKMASNAGWKVASFPEFERLRERFAAVTQRRQGGTEPDYKLLKVAVFKLATRVGLNGTSGVTPQDLERALLAA